MFCTNCGQELRDGAKFCTNCGKSLEPAAAPVELVSEPTAEPVNPGNPTSAEQGRGDYTPPVRQEQPVYTQSVQQPIYRQQPERVQQPVLVPVTEDRGSPAIPIIALIMGLLAVFFFWVPFLDFIFALLAIIFGAVGLKKRLKGMAIAGLVIGIIFLIISIIWTVAACVGAAFLESNPLYYEMFKDAFRDAYYY